MADFWVEGVAGPIGAVANTIASATAVTLNGIPGIATIAAMWTEAVILEADVQISCISPPPGPAGAMVWWIDEKSRPAPTATDARATMQKLTPMSSANPDSSVHFFWKAKAVEDLIYTDLTAITGAAFYIYGYTDAANFGSAAGTSTVFYRRVMCRIRCRGLTF
jgi:hypothetical protein